MKIDISFRLKSRPKSIRPAGRILSLLGFLLLIFGSILSLSPEIRSIFGLATWLLVSLTTFGLVLTYFGFFLTQFDWRNGILTLDQNLDEIRIDGEVPNITMLKDINELTILNSKLGIINKSIQIKTPGDLILVRFKDENNFLEIMEFLIEKTEAYPNIVINKYTD